MPLAVSDVRADHVQCCGPTLPSSHALPLARTRFRYVHRPLACGVAFPSSFLSFRATHIRAEATPPPARSRSADSVRISEACGQCGVSFRVLRAHNVDVAILKDRLA